MQLLFRQVLVEYISVYHGRLFILIPQDKSRSTFKNHHDLYSYSYLFMSHKAACFLLFMSRQ